METDSSPTGTRAALIRAGLHLFGRDGFAASSTRALAAQAGTNVASIAYHFGSKEGLRHACAEEIAQRIGTVAGPPRMPPDMPPAQALAQLETMLRALTAFLTRAPEAADTVAFLLREMAGQGPAFDLFYEHLLLPKHRELCALTGMVTGRDPEAEETKLLVFSLLGQAVYFRIGQPLVSRRMGWRAYDAAQSQAIADRLVANMRAVLGDAS